MGRLGGGRAGMEIIHLSGVSVNCAAQPIKP